MKNIKTIKTYFLDASALVKLVIKENGTKQLRDLLQKPEHFATTIICVAESLGKLKRDYVKKNLDLHQYLDAVYVLLAYVREERGIRGEIEIDKTNIQDRDVFSEVESIVKKYKIDVSDALQICILKNKLKYPVKTETILITADKKLAKTARQEGLNFEIV